MAFLKFSRDKRGYENFYLLQPSVRGKPRPRLLYWFRTPPSVKVGRTPFDPDVRRALEAQNPDVAFDWTAITQTPIPPADNERWRERRRVERAMRTASEAESSGVETEQEPDVPARLSPGELDAAPHILEATAEPLTIAPVDPEGDAAAAAESASNSSSPVPPTAGGGPTRHRKRRRRGRRKGPSGSRVPAATSTGAETTQNDAPHNDSEAPADDNENLEP